MAFPSFKLVQSALRWKAGADPRPSRLWIAMKPELRCPGAPFVEHWRQISHEALALISFRTAGGVRLRALAGAEARFPV